MSTHSKAFLQLKKQKEQIEKALKEIEKSIYEDEAQFLEESQPIGNIIKGWDSINIKQHNKFSFPTIQKKVRFTNEERVLSSSSITSPVYVEEQHESKKIVTKADNKKKLRNKKKKGNEEYAYDDYDDEYSADKDNEDVMSVENNI